jgi:hypothetical protein
MRRFRSCSCRRLPRVCGCHGRDHHQRAQALPCRSARQHRNLCEANGSAKPQTDGTPQCRAARVDVRPLPARGTQAEGGRTDGRDGQWLTKSSVVECVSHDAEITRLVQQFVVAVGRFQADARRDQARRAPRPSSVRQLPRRCGDVGSGRKDGQEWPPFAHRAAAERPRDGRPHLLRVGHFRRRFALAAGARLCLCSWRHLRLTCVRSPRTS